MNSPPLPAFGGHGFVSADDHVMEAADVWTSRMSKSRWGDRIPRIADLPDGSQQWVIDGQPLPLRLAGLAGAMQPDRTLEPRRWDEFDPAVLRADARLGSMDADGTSHAVLYPTVAGLAGGTFGRVTDAALELACVQAYNDWLVEEWAGVSKRFIPQCIVPLGTVDAMVTEIRRAVNIGHRGVVFPMFPQLLRDVPHINDPAYDALWATCQELAVPLCLHAGASSEMQYPADPTLSPVLTDALDAITRPLSSISGVSNLLISGILSRFPGMKVVFAESTFGWAQFVLETADYHHGTFQLGKQGYDLMPSDLFKRQCYLTSWYDRTGLKHSVEQIGAGNLLWSSNFPQATSRWPDSRSTSLACFGDIAGPDRERILRANALELYRIEV